MKIEPFGVEIWMNQFENQCEYNLAETCVASLTVAELLEMSVKNTDVLEDLMPMKLTYGFIEGSDRLRDAISTLYDNQTRDNIVVTHGAVGANALVHETIVEPGDHVISVRPTYQQHYSIPESYGATVDILQLRPENGFIPDLDEFAGMVRPETKLIAINNPNNPTGALMDADSSNGSLRLHGTVRPISCVTKCIAGLHRMEMGSRLRWPIFMSAGSAWPVCPRRFH